MKYIIKAALVLVLTLAVFGVAAAKTRKRYCTVNLIGGGLVKGYFVGANGSQLFVEVDGVRKIIKIDHVANIVFIVDFKNQRMKDVEP